MIIIVLLFIVEKEEEGRKEETHTHRDACILISWQGGEVNEETQGVIYNNKKGSRWFLRLAFLTAHFWSLVRMFLYLCWALRFASSLSRDRRAFFFSMLSMTRDMDHHPVTMLTAASVR